MDRTDNEMDVGILIGQQQAFGALSGRCSAAQAACLRLIYEKQLYKQRCAGWDEFCRDHLHMARSNAEKIIKLLNEFGPEYFELSQLTRVSAETYRAIQPALRNGNLLVEGEAIALIPENTARISAAVANIRKAARPARAKAEPPAPPSEKERLATLGGRCKDVLEEFTDLLGTRRHQHELAAMMVELQTGLDRLQLQV